MLEKGLYILYPSYIYEYILLYIEKVRKKGIMIVIEIKSNYNRL